MEAHGAGRSRELQNKSFMANSDYKTSSCVQGKACDPWKQKLTSAATILLTPCRCVKTRKATHPPGGILNQVEFIKLLHCPGKVKKHTIRGLFCGFHGKLPTRY